MKAMKLSGILRILMLLLGLACSCAAFQVQPNSYKQPFPSPTSSGRRKQLTALPSQSATLAAPQRPIDSVSFLPFPSVVEVPKVRNYWVEELLGEAFGTFWIVAIGSMASMAATFVNPFMSLPEVAMIWSMAATSAILITSPMSGAHLNPAMTLALAVFRDFEWRKVLPYCTAQIMGSMTGSAVSFGLFRSVIRDYEQTQGLIRSSCLESARVFGEYFDPSSLSALQATGIEALGTFILASIVFAMTHPSRKTQQEDNHINIVPFVVGGTVFSLINTLAPYTQCGMNPARDFGPRIVASLAGWNNVAFQDCWVYIVGPVIGALAGATLIDKVLFKAVDRDQRIRATFTSANVE